MKYKSVTAYHQLEFESMSPKLRGVNIFAKDYAIEPFLVFTEYHMTGQVFGPHPHAGISVLTYMMPDSQQGFINRDSQGDHSSIDPGGYHITQAGSGMHHDEFPKESGKDAHGFQIWINHSEENRMVESNSMHAMADEVPVVESEDAIVRIIHGEYRDNTAAHQMVTSVSLFDVQIKPGGSIDLPGKEMAFVYGVKGSAEIDGKPISPQSLSILSKEGNTVKIQSNQGVNFLYGSAIPIDEPIIYGGPFVMTTKEQMRDARKRLGRGEMGHLESHKY